MIPVYRETFKNNNFEEKVKQAEKLLKSCTLCPHQCKVDRLKDKSKFCKASCELVISGIHSHFGEEPPLSGNSGSGTIFFTHCNLECIYCQNYQISQQGLGDKITSQELAEEMLKLQAKGCHNINLVSPTHFLPQILNALLLAIDKGLNIPIVYNTNGYDRVEILKILDGIIDIYLPDIKYSNDIVAKELSSVNDYVLYNRDALKEMHRQVGDLTVNKEGIATKGLLIRHLVLPNDLSGSFDSLNFIARNISRDTTISIMAQYHPCYRADKYIPINRTITVQEYKKVIEICEHLGLNNILTQELTSHDAVPDFSLENPFQTFKI